jgi:hypothetical protein
VLEKDGITCNMTLLFNFYQAVRLCPPRPAPVPAPPRKGLGNAGEIETRGCRGLSSVWADAGAAAVRHRAQVACAEAKATLISPFVGRILDWYRPAPPSCAQWRAARRDPGPRVARRVRGDDA